jgi:hypothetical protein
MLVSSQLPTIHTVESVRGRRVGASGEDDMMMMVWLAILQLQLLQLGLIQQRLTPIVLLLDGCCCTAYVCFVGKNNGANQR